MQEKEWPAILKEGIVAFKAGTAEHVDIPVACAVEQIRRLVRYNVPLTQVYCGGRVHLVYLSKDVSAIKINIERRDVEKDVTTGC